MNTDIGHTHSKNPAQQILDTVKVDNEDLIQRAYAESRDGAQLFITRGDGSVDGRSYGVIVPIGPSEDITGKPVIMVRVSTGYVVVGKISDNNHDVDPEIVTVSTKAGVPSDADFETTPPDGTMVLNESTFDLYIRGNGVWRFLTPQLAPLVVTGNRAGTAPLTDLLSELDAIGMVDDQTTNTPPAVTGSRGGNAALADLLTELETLGIIDDQTTA